jgi:hypothetical protein
MLRRQTPQRVFYMFGPIRGALVWGLDTGLMVTTYRITAATWATLSLCVLGFLPWWTGVIYATGFLLPVAIAVLIVPPRQGPPDSTVEPIWILDRISQHVHAVYRLAFILLAASTAALIVVVVR